MTRDDGTPEETGGSLAEQAAAWVPPWSRPADAEPETRSEEEEATESGPVSEQDWDWDDEDSSNTIDIAAELKAAEEPTAILDPEPVEPVEPLPPLEPGEPLPPAEPLPPLEPMVPDEPFEPLVPDEPILTATVPAAELKGALEAILLVVDEPVGEIMLAQITEQPTERILATLRGLAAEYDEQRRGFELRSVAGGWRFYTRTTYAPYVERFVLDGQQVRLTQAALETLAVIAYKQPVTRSRISAIRGVNCDGVVRTLLSRGLIEECGSEPDSGAHLYRTTLLFLEKLGLNSVDELPPLAPFLPDDVEALADAT